MAVNKNFVVKNGLEVNSNLLVADLDTQTVGIGTTIAPHEFHVVGGIGVTNLLVTGVATIANLRVTGPSTFVGVTTFTDNNVFIDKQLFVNGISITGGSGGSIGTDLVVERHVRAGGIVTFSDSLFVGSGLGQSTGTSGQVFQVAGVSSDAYIGGTLGIGTTNPQDLALHVVGDTRFVGVNTFQGDVVVTGNLDVTGDITYDEITGRNLNISGLSTFQTLTAGRVALVGTGDTLTDDANLAFVKGGGQLVVGVGATVGGGLTASSVMVEDLTNNRVVIAGTDGELEDSSNFVFDGSQLILGVGATVGGALTVAGATDLNGALDVTGETNFSSGVGIADSIFHIGDDNTQIRFPAADTFTIETAGTEALRVNSSQHVGVGTDNPSDTNSFTRALDVSGPSGSAVYVRTNGSSSNFGLLGHFGTTLHLRNESNGDLRFSTNASEKVRITSAGNVAIGTITATDVLQVEGSAAVARFVGNRADALGPRLSLAKSRSADSGSSTIVQDGDEIGQIMFKGADGNDVDSTGAAIVGLVNGSPGSNDMPGALTFLTTSDGNNSPSERVRVTSGGDVGIGTITPKGSHAVTASNTAVLAVGVVTAREYYGDGSNLSGLPQSGIGIRSDGTAVGFGVTFLDFIGSGVGTATVDTASGIATVNISGGGGSVTINNNADNRLITGSGTADTLEGEANLTFDGSQFAVVSGGATVGGGLTVAGIGIFKDDVQFHGANGVTTAFFDKSANALNFVDGAKAQFGTGNDLQIYHDGTNTIIENTTGNLYILDNDAVILGSASGTESYFKGVKDGAAELYYDNTKTFETGSDGVIATGIITATGGFDLGIHSGGSSVVSGPIKILNFIGTGNTFAYNASTDTVDISIAGSSGGGGGVSETDTTVSTVNPTGVGSFATASFRSASVIAQINQLNTNFQVGRYLMIHDGTTVTVVEESAVSTGSTMLGSFTGVIDGSNVELRVTLATAGVSTVTTKIDTVTV